MFSTVLFSVTLCPTAAQARPFALRTSFWGSMNTTAVSVGVRPVPDRCPGLTLVLDDWASDWCRPSDDREAGRETPAAGLQEATTGLLMWAVAGHMSSPLKCGCRWCI